MPSRFRRYAEGYGFLGYYWLGGLLKSGSSLIATLGDGPGECVGVQIAQLSGAYSNFVDAMVKIELDGLEAYDGYLYWLLMAYPGNVAHTMFATCDLPAAYYSVISWSIPMSFADTYKATFYTSNATGNNVYININLYEGS